MTKNQADYAAKLRDPRWQKLRLMVLDAAGWKCLDCEAADKTLHVHHTFYIYGREPWEYEPWEFRCLCDGCHEIRHEVEHDAVLEMKRKFARMNGKEIAAFMWSMVEERIALGHVHPKRQEG